MSHYTDYNEVSKSYDTGRKAADAHMLKSLMESFTGKNIRDMDILDIGCGTGNYSEYFLLLEPKSLSLMDGSKGMLNKAQNKMTSSSSRTKLSFKEVILPEMPYEDNSFDAGMINMVLHHLEKNPDGKSFPTVTRTLQEAFRVLKPGGVLTVLTETPETLNGNWFAHLAPQTTKRWQKRLPTHQQFRGMLRDAGFSLKSASKILMSSYLPDYENLDGPLHESWRNLNSYWKDCTESEIQDMIKNMNQMKNEGTLKTFFETHDQIHATGVYEIFAARKEI